MMSFLLAHWPLALVALISGVMLLGPWWGQKSGSLPGLNPHETVHKINRERGVVLDVRPAADYQAGHLPESVHVPLDTWPDGLKAIANRKQRPVIVLAANTRQVTSAYQQLQQAGFVDVRVLQGGLDAWRAENLPVVKAKGAP